jgi:chromosome segregation ATPase
MFKKSYEIPINMANQYKRVPRFHSVLKDENNKFLNEFKYHEKLKTLNDIEGIQPVGDPTNIHHSRVANSLVSAVEEKAEAVEATKVEKAAKAAQPEKYLSKMKKSIENMEKSSKQTEEVRKRAKELLIKTNHSLKKMNESLKNWKEFKQKEPKQNMHLSQKLSQPSSPRSSSPRSSSPRSINERQKDAIKEHFTRMSSTKKSVNEELNRLLKKPSTVEQRRTKLNDLQKELTAISKVMNVKSPKYKNMNTLWNSIKNLIDDLIVNINHPKYDTKYNYIIENMQKLKGYILSQGGRRTHKKHKIAKYKTRKNHISK